MRKPLPSVAFGILLWIPAVAIGQEERWFRNGLSSDASLGESVCEAGDVNRDGCPDVIVSAPGTNQGRGRVRVYSGCDGSTLHEWSGTVPFGSFGRSVSAAGDVNGDGFGDVMVGAPGGATGGVVFVYSGWDGSEIRQLLPTVGCCNFGWSLAKLGDQDGDGVPEHVVGHPGGDRAVVFSGRTGVLRYELIGGVSLCEFGYSVCGLGDLDGDQIEDVIVGAPQTFFSNPPGYARLCSGANGTTITDFWGVVTRAFFGSWVGSAGDVNGDGTADFLIIDAGQGAGVLGVHSGADYSVMYSFARPHASPLGDLDGDGFGDLALGGCDAAVISGRTGQELSTWEHPGGPPWGNYHVASAVGDVNGDGLRDLVVGLPQVTQAMPGQYVGAACVLTSDDFFLHASPNPVVGGQTLTLLASLGEHGDPVVLFATAANGVPIAPLSIGAGYALPDGRWALRAPIPPGLSGAITLRSYMLRLTNQWVVDSNDETVTFQ